MKFALPIIVLATVGTLTAAPKPLKMNPVPAETLASATKQAEFPMRFRYDMAGGAHTNSGNISGLLLVQSLASYLGNPKDDDSFIKQIRFMLEGPNTISANGGYPAQHETIFLSSLVVARETPSIWKQFTDEEKKKIDLLFKAHLVGNAFTTSDQTNPKGAGNPFSMDGSTNQHRDWNANYREGMIGGLILGAIWLGPKEAQAFLDKYDHVKFTEQLKAAGLTNTYEIFTWKTLKPESNAPTPELVNEALHGFLYKGKDITDPMDLFLGLSVFTYGGIVSAGLNKGEGKDGGGVIAQNADKLPNVGKKGMLMEFAGLDGKGARSSIYYCYTGFRPNLAKQIALMVTGHLDYSHPKWKEVFDQIRIGNEDLFFKLTEGYYDYSHGNPAPKPITIESKGGDTIMMRDLWEKVILPYHESQTK